MLTEADQLEGGSVPFQAVDWPGEGGWGQNVGRSRIQLNPRPIWV